MKVANELNIELDEKDVQRVHRLGIKKTLNPNLEQSLPGLSGIKNEMN